MNHSTLSVDEKSDHDWDDHWSAYAKATEINPAQQWRYQVIVELIEGQLAKLNSITLLAVGSGQGDLLKIISQRFPKVRYAGIDVSQSGIAEAQRKVPGGLFIHHDLTQQYQPLGEGLVPIKANLVVCSEVLEHIDVPGRFLENLKDFLEPNAHLIITVPGGPKSFFDNFIGHKRHYRRSDLVALLNGAGFETTAALAMGFPFFNLYKTLLIFRGQRMVDDAKILATQQALGFVGRAICKTFRFLFRLNLDFVPLGWQTVVVAVNKKTGAHQKEL